MLTFLADFRYGCRILLKSPGFAAIAILALALGIGANTAIFSAVDAVLLRPLPYPAAHELVMVWEDASHQSFPRNTPAPANYFDWAKQNTVFTGMAAFRYRNANLTGDGEPEMVIGLGVTPSLFSVMGVNPLVGRAFTVEEDRKQKGSDFDPRIVAAPLRWRCPDCRSHDPDER
jgi:putative ABC transport system permease protein